MANADSAFKPIFSGSVWFFALLIAAALLVFSFLILDHSRALLLSGTGLQIFGAIATALFSFFGWKMNVGDITRGAGKGYTFTFPEIEFNETLTRWGYWGFLYIIVGLCLVAVPDFLTAAQEALDILATQDSDSNNAGF
ncbi:MAG: hypothetical protein QNJ44_16835 [Rhodobacter sp.]|nr:hypothetical protein [Rhodobacter sp.]